MAARIFAVLLLISLALLAGFMVGRAHPAHHYQYGQMYRGVSPMYDTTTGKICNPMRPAREKAYDVNTAMDKAAVPVTLDDPALHAACGSLAEAEKKYGLAESPKIDLSAGLIVNPPAPEVQHVRAEDMIPACGNE